jgi:hypothetical protein
VGFSALTLERRFELFGEHLPAKAIARGEPKWARPEQFNKNSIHLLRRFLRAGLLNQEPLTRGAIALRMSSVSGSVVGFLWLDVLTQFAREAPFVVPGLLDEVCFVGLGGDVSGLAQSLDLAGRRSVLAVAAWGGESRDVVRARMAHEVGHYVLHQRHLEPAPAPAGSLVRTEALVGHAEELGGVDALFALRASRECEAAAFAAAHGFRGDAADPRRARADSVAALRRTIDARGRSRRRRCRAKGTQVLI